MEYPPEVLLQTNHILFVSQRSSRALVLPQSPPLLHFSSLTTLVNSPTRCTWLGIRQ
jgi:hypothetical protein